jgi:1-acyl-sn-glycerol-3-phosphate acyltransferase
MEDWHYQTAPDLDRNIIDRLKRFPREPEMMVYVLRSSIALAIRGWLRLYHRLEIEGQEHIPKEGSFVMVANHSSHLDVLCLLSALPLQKLHRAFPAAAKDYFFERLPRLAASVVVVNAFPFDRQINPRQSIELCRQLLANPGNVLILFPEGSRCKSGEIGEFKSGIGWLLAGTDFPVLPCHLSGTHAALQKGTRIPRPRKILARIGSARIYSDLSREKASVHQIRDELRQAVIELGESKSRE